MCKRSGEAHGIGNFFVDFYGEKELKRVDEKPLFAYGKQMSWIYTFFTPLSTMLYIYLGLDFLNGLCKLMVLFQLRFYLFNCVNDG